MIGQCSTCLSLKDQRPEGGLFDKLVFSVVLIGCGTARLPSFSSLSVFDVVSRQHTKLLVPAAVVLCIRFAAPDTTQTTRDLQVLDAKQIN